MNSYAKIILILLSTKFWHEKNIDAVKEYRLAKQKQNNPYLCNTKSARASLVVASAL
nr:MAG TPA: hypothetical protein [Caudoviricetes sp.]